MELWTSVFADIKAAGGPEFATIGAEGIAFKIWFKSPADEDESSSIVLVPGDEPHVPPLTMAKSGPATGKPTPAKEPVLSAGVLEDMAAQNASNPGQIGYLNAAIHLGYHPSPAECEGLSHGDTAASSDKLRKSSKMPGAHTFVDAVTASKKETSSVPLDNFVSRLLDSLNSVADDHAGYAAIAAGKISQVYSRVKSTAIEEMAVVYYMEEYILWTFRGRGLPTPMNLEVLNRAEKRALQVARKAGGGSSSGGTGRSDQDAAIMEQLKELGGLAKRFDSLETRLAKLDGLEAKVGRFDSRIDGLASKLGQMGGPSKENKDKHITCNKCGKKGHREANCTEE